MNEPKVGDTYYRYEDGLYYEKDTHDSEHMTAPELRVYRVTRVTPCGVWITNGLWRDKHFVLNMARKRFAYPTEELALNSYLIRKKHHVWHCEFRLRKSKHFLEQAEKMSKMSVGERDKYVATMGLM